MSDDRSKQVYIGYLPNDARMDDVEDFFKGEKRKVFSKIDNQINYRFWQDQIHQFETRLRIC